MPISEARVLSLGRSGGVGHVGESSHGAGVIFKIRYVNPFSINSINFTNLNLIQHKNVQPTSMNAWALLINDYPTRYSGTFGRWAHLLGVQAARDCELLVLALVPTSSVNCTSAAFEIENVPEIYLKYEIH